MVTTGLCDFIKIDLDMYNAQMSECNEVSQSAMHERCKKKSHRPEEATARHNAMKRGYQAHIARFEEKISVELGREVKNDRELLDALLVEMGGWQYDAETYTITRRPSHLSGGGC